MYGNKVEICGINTADLPVMKDVEMEDMMKRIRSGDRQLREQFIMGNLRLVLSVVQRFPNRGESPDDIFQVGCIGLIKALDHFDTSHGVRFSTYAVPMIIGEIRRYLRDNNAIRVSRSLRDLAYRALRAREELMGVLGKEPGMDEIAALLEVPREDVVLALDSIQDTVSLYDPVFRDNEDPVFLMDQIRDREHTEERWTSGIAICEAMVHLKPRERMIVDRRFFDGRTQTEVAGEIGISQAQVSRLEKSALSSMKQYMM
ncbi:MAG: RNA polymerase sporulation sigma factor SigG [Anaerovoracaceae bacterium]